MSTTEYYTEERHGPHQIFDLGDFTLESGHHAAQRQARLQDPRHAEFGEKQRDPVPAHVVGNAEGHGDLHWRRPTDRPAQVFHHLARSVCQWFHVFTQQHTAAVQWRSVPKRHDRRRCQRPASPAQRALRHRAPGAGARLVDGRRADLRMGGALSRHGQAGAAVRRHRQDDPARLHLRAQPRGRAQVRPGLEQWLLPASERRPRRPAAPCPDLVGDGTVSGFLSTGKPGARSGSPRSRTSCTGSGRRISRPWTRTT